MKALITRRRFLQTSTLGGVGLLILRDCASAQTYQAHDKLNLAVVGVGKRGGYWAQHLPQVRQNLVAVCDANRQLLERSFGESPKAARFQDFRRMFDQMADKLDGVIVATPDHTHAVIAAAAMKRGKHVYVEKPIAHDVAEARALRRLAAEKRVATQMGNQGMASDRFRRTLELVREGAVGEIREAHLWFMSGGSGPRPRPSDTPPVPEHIDWDLFLGPARFRPYHPTYFNGWWAWREYSTGMLGGGGSHSIHMTFKALNLQALWDGAGAGKARIYVEAETPGPCPENMPRWEIVRFEVPARGPLPPARIHWYSMPEAELKRRGILERLEKIAGRSLDWQKEWEPRCGSLLVGSKGVVHTNPHNSLCALLPEADFPNAGGPPQTLPRVRGHDWEWFQACKAGPSAISNFDHSGPAMELLLLGNIATQVRQPFDFDPVSGRIPNHPEADALLRIEPRAGWSLY